jgi:uncharacterized protein (TIGR02677 family)
VTSETADAWRDLPPGTAWRDAPPIRISPQLRKTGSYERRGQPNQVRDRSADREFLRRQAEREAAETAAARRRLRTPGPTLLSDLGVLDTRSFGLFLALLGDALAARMPGEAEVKTVTSDGTLEVRLSLVPDGGTATIRTAGGLLTGPEHVIEITEVTAS